MPKISLFLMMMSVALAGAAQQLPDAPSAGAPAAALPTANAAPQAPAAASAGNWEIGVTAGGGHSFLGGIGTVSDTGFFNANLRLGYVLSGQHGPGLLRGNFEYAGEITPVNVIFQQSDVYGFSFTPVLLKWNFTAGQKVVPYAELGGGLLLTTSDVPAGANTLNFTPQAAAGVQIFHRPGRAISAAVRWVHISDAYLTRYNPGIDSIRVTLGYHWWKGR